MAELKQGRWVHVHEPGQANYVESENVMDIVIGAGRCQAEATYTVRSYKKAAYWLEEYLRIAQALQIVADEVIPQIKEAAEKSSRDDEAVTASGEGWNCEIEKMCDGSFKVRLVWNVDEEITKKQKPPKKKTAKEKKTAEEKAEPKKRGRKPGKKKEEAKNEADA